MRARRPTHGPRASAAARALPTFLLLAAAAGPAAADVPFESPLGLVVVRAEAGVGDPVMVRTLRLLLDTGDPGGLTLRAPAARALGLAIGPGRPGVTRGPGGSKPVVRRSARLPDLRLDGARWRDCSVDVVEADDTIPAGMGAPVDGI